MYPYIRDAISRSSIPELVLLYQQSVVSKEGKNVRELINDSLQIIGGSNGFPKVQSFQELVQLYDNRISPLKNMYVTQNGFILIAGNQKIPFEKREFFILLRRASFIRGVRVVFGKADKMSFCCIKDERNFRLSLFTESIDDMLAMSRVYPSTLTLNELCSVKEIDCYFENGVTTNVLGNEIRYYSKQDGYVTVGELIVEMILNKRKEIVFFEGVNDTGQYIKHSKLERQKHKHKIYLYSITNNNGILSNHPLSYRCLEKESGGIISHVSRPIESSVITLDAIDPLEKNLSILFSEFSFQNYEYENGMFFFNPSYDHVDEIDFGLGDNKVVELGYCTYCMFSETTLYIVFYGRYNDDEIIIEGKRYNVEKATLQNSYTLIKATLK